MPAILSITIIPALRVPLFILGLAAFAYMVVSANKRLLRKASGWKTITERFPMADTQPTGATFEGRTAIVGSTSYTRSFVIRIADGGLCLYPAFARSKPCRIPWASIRQVTASDSIHVVVDYERRFEFFLPLKAMPAIQARHSAPSVHRLDSPFTAVKAAIADPTTPRWMAWITDRVLQGVQREVEKKKERDNDAV